MSTRRAATVGFAVWGLVALMMLASLTFEGLVLTGPLSCELVPGSSVFGQSHWSWIPLGRYCVYDLGNGLPQYVVGPSMRRGWVALTLLGWPLSLYALLRAIRSAEQRATESKVGGLHPAMVEDRGGRLD